MKYRTELKNNKYITEIILIIKLKKIVTLVYAARDKEHTHALVLKSFLEKICVNT